MQIATREEKDTMIKSLRHELSKPQDKCVSLLLLYKLMCLSWCNEKDIYSITNCTEEAVCKAPYFMSGTIRDLGAFVQKFITYGPTATNRYLELLYGSNGIRFLSSLLKVEQEVYL